MRTLTNLTLPTSCPMTAITRLDMGAPNADTTFVPRTGRFLTIVALEQTGVFPTSSGHAVLLVEELFASASTNTNVVNFIFRGGFREKDDATLLPTIMYNCIVYILSSIIFPLY